jgi:hypothetical protein
MAKWTPPKRRAKNRKPNGKTGRSCHTGKVRFRDKQSADRARQTIQAHSTRDKVACRAYACDLCHGWHLTSMERYGK